MTNPLASFIVPLVWAAFAGAALLAVILGAILAYHWYRYAMNPGIATAALITYAVVTGLLLAGVLGAAIAVQVTF